MHNLLNFDTESFKFRVCSFNIEEQEFLNELKSDINTNKYIKVSPTSKKLTIAIGLLFSYTIRVYLSICLCFSILSLVSFIY